MERERGSAGLTRSAHALCLVSPPVVWLVVEAAREAGPTAWLLRRTGVVYRHLTYGDNFTSEAWEEERHHQRNQALAHIKQHRPRGIVLFEGPTSTTSACWIASGTSAIRSLIFQNEDVSEDFLMQLSGP